MFLTLPWSPDEYRYLHDRTPKDESVDADDEKGWGSDSKEDKQPDPGRFGDAA
jgi:hypothetical protein